MELSIELIPTGMPVAVAFAEQAAKAAGLETSAAAMLALSTEELFMSLCNSIPERTIILGFKDRRHAVDLTFFVPQPPPDLGIFNITSRPDHATEEGLAGMGLYLASRACDQFSVRRQPNGGWEILLRKERSYPRQETTSTENSTIVTDWRITSDAGPEPLKQLSQLIGRRYSACQFPEEFTPSGRLLDKLAGGHYGAVVAEAVDGRLAGGMIWHIGNNRIVHCFGPYLTETMNNEQLSIELCEKLTELFGRSERLGLLIQSPLPLPPAAGFEASGSVITPSGELWCGYRMLTEEFGAVAVVAEELLPFYEHLSNSMALARNLRPYRDSGESGDGTTLFATRLNRVGAMAHLRPLLVGRDAGMVLEDHLRLLDSERFSAVYCQLDTGRPYDALLAPHLLKQGFSPRILVPWGGSGDLILLFRAGAGQ